ncbi:hypothetical protein ACFLZW_03320 [Chloroflexota bacterium]
MGADLYIDDTTKGYFRDSYNDFSILWKFNLSWWENVLDVYTDADGEMSPENAMHFLQTLKECEPIFDENLKRMGANLDENAEEDCKYYKKRYKELKAFLRRAIRLGKCIQSWL